jgi:hypothetical protein
MGTANKKFVEQYFYGLIVGDGVLVRVPSHGILLRLFSSSFYRLALSLTTGALGLVEMGHEFDRSNSGHGVADLLGHSGLGFGRLCWWFWLGSAGFGGVARIFPAMFGLLPPLGRDEQPGLTATIHRRETFRAWDELR